MYVHRRSMAENGCRYERYVWAYVFLRLRPCAQVSRGRRGDRSWPWQRRPMTSWHGRHRNPTRRNRGRATSHWSCPSPNQHANRGLRLDRPWGRDGWIQRDSGDETEGYFSLLGLACVRFENGTENRQKFRMFKGEDSERTWGSVHASVSNGNRSVAE